MITEFHRTKTIKTIKNKVQSGKLLLDGPYSVHNYDILVHDLKDLQMLYLLEGLPSRRELVLIAARNEIQRGLVELIILAKQDNLTNDACENIYFRIARATRAAKKENLNMVEMYAKPRMAIRCAGLMLAHQYTSKQPSNQVILGFAQDLLNCCKYQIPEELHRVLKNVERHAQDNRCLKGDIPISVQNLYRPCREGQVTFRPEACTP